MMNPKDIIADAKSRVQQFRGSVDPKWLNKTLSRLDDAWAMAHLLDADPAIDKAACTCPKGATDKECPIHGN